MGFNSGFKGLKTNGGGVEVQLYSFFTSAPDGGERSNIVTTPLYEIS